MTITSGVRHFVMAITSAEAMARHTAFGDGHHIGPDGHYTGVSWAQLLCFFSYARKEPWKIVIRRDSKTGAITIMGRMMRGLFAVLALLTTAVSIAQAGERDLPVKCLTRDGVEVPCAARQHLPPNKQNALPRTARPSVLPPPEYDKPKEP
jgi:hypothetical protein